MFFSRKFNDRLQYELGVNHAKSVKKIATDLTDLVAKLARARSFLSAREVIFEYQNTMNVSTNSFIEIAVGDVRDDIYAGGLCPGTQALSGDKSDHATKIVVINLVDICDQMICRFNQIESEIAEIRAKQNGMAMDG